MYYVCNLHVFKLIIVHLQGGHELDVLWRDTGHEPEMSTNDSIFLTYKNNRSND